MLLFSSRSAALAERIGPRLQLTVGPLLAAAGLLLLMRIGPDASWVRHVLPGAVVFGLGLVTFVAPLTATVMGSVDPDQVSTASGRQQRHRPHGQPGRHRRHPGRGRTDDGERAGRGHRRRADRRSSSRRCSPPPPAPLCFVGLAPRAGVATLGPPGALRGGRPAAAT